MTAFDDFLVVSILGFLALIIWSRIMSQTMSDTVSELKDIVTNIFGANKE